MFDKLTERLQGVIESLRGRGRLTEDNIADTLRQVRMALLEADVALPVVKSFVDSIKTKVVGQEIEKSLTPGQALVSLIHQELIALMGEGVRPLNSGRSLRSSSCSRAYRAPVRRRPRASSQSGSKKTNANECCSRVLTSIARRQSSNYNAWPSSSKSRSIPPIRRSRR
jgi:hypothetical protein